MNDTFTYIARAIVLFTAMPIHEFAHGYTAYLCGDDTARLQGRLTLNPFYHLDPIGSVLLLFAGFGWAKPVPVNSRRLKNPRRDMALTALAGPLANIAMALIVMILFKITILAGVFSNFWRNQAQFTLYFMIYYIIQINLYLAVFNLLPVPPLDGSKILGNLMPNKLYWSMVEYERYITYIVFFLIIFTDVLTGPLSFVANGVFSFLDIITFPLGRL